MVPAGNVLRMLFHEGWSSNLRIMGEFGHAAHTCSNPHIKCMIISFIQTLLVIVLRGFADSNYSTRQLLSINYHTRSLCERSLAQPSQVYLQGNKSINKYCSVNYRKLMTDMQCIPQSCRKKNNVYQPHSNNIHQLYNTSTHMSGNIVSYRLCHKNLSFAVWVSDGVC
jgi:hypothetical protein